MKLPAIGDALVEQAYRTLDPVEDVFDNRTGTDPSTLYTDGSARPQSFDDIAESAVERQRQGREALAEFQKTHDKW
jgi:hypothetical protein